MSSHSDPYYPENNTGKLLVMVLVLLVIIGAVFALVYFFKPEGDKVDNKTGSVRNTAKEQIEALDPEIRKVYNLTEELQLFDDLFDELVYSEEPNVNNIGSFVSRYNNFEARYSTRNNNPVPFGISPGVYDSALISYDFQQKYMTRSVEMLLASLEKKRKVFMTIPVTFPMDKEVARIVSGFGMRDHPILKEKRLHAGIDIAAPVGTAVRATASGQVIFTEEKPGYGRSCLVQHKFGFQTRYAHLVRTVVGKGNWLQKGEIIGYVGNTGMSEAPHLHYEVRKNEKPINPSYFLFEGLTKEEYKEVVNLGSKLTNVLSF